MAVASEVNQAEGAPKHSRAGCWHLLAIFLIGPLVGVCLLVSCWAVSRRYFEYRVASLAGPGATDCGFVRLRQSQAAALQCAQDAMKDNRPFHAIFQRLGVDSTVLNGIARDRHGKIYTLHYDGGIGAPSPSMRLYRCDHIQLSQPVSDWRAELRRPPFTGACHSME